MRTHERMEQVETAEIWKIFHHDQENNEVLLAETGGMLISMKYEN